MRHLVNAIPVVRSFYRQKPRRQHLCIVERLLDFVVVAGADLRLSDDRRVTTPRFTSCPAATTFITWLRGLACIF